VRWPPASSQWGYSRDQPAEPSYRLEVLLTYDAVQCTVTLGIVLRGGLENDGRVAEKAGSVTIAGALNRPRMRRWGYAFLGAALLTTVAAVIWGVPRVEASRAAAVQEELDRRGWSEITVEFDGRDAQVAGTVPAGVTVHDVETVVASVAGVRAVSDMVMVMAETDRSRQESLAPTPDSSPRPTLAGPVTIPETGPVDAARLILANNGGLIVLRGTADDMLAGLLGHEAGLVFGADNVENRIEPSERGSISQEWVEMVTTTIALLQDFDNVTVRVNSDLLEYEGQVLDDAAGEQLTRRLSEITSGVVDISGSFDVVRTSDPLVVMDIAAGAVTLRGQVATAEAVDGLEDQLRTIFGSVTNELVTGADRAHWVAALPLSYLPRSGRYTLTVTSGEEVELTGSVVTDSSRARVVSAFTRAGFEVTDGLVAGAAFAQGQCTDESLNEVGLSEELFGTDGTVVQDSSRANAVLTDLSMRVGMCDGMPITMLVYTDGRMAVDEAHEFAHERGGALLEALSSFGLDPYSIGIVGVADTRGGGRGPGQQLSAVQFQVMMGGD